MYRWLNALAVPLLLGAPLAASPNPGESLESEFAQEEQAERPRGRARLGALLRDPEIRHQLGITQEQLDRLTEGAYQHRRRLIRLRADLRLERLEMRRLLREDVPDRRALLEGLERLIQLRGEIARARLERRLEGREVLSPDQRQQLRDLARERRLERRRAP